jgi:hypothetical protein
MPCNVYYNMQWSLLKFKTFGAGGSSLLYDDHDS